MAAMALILALCALAVGLQGVSGVTLDVGDDKGWTVPATISATYSYSDWASNHTFRKGDVLFFKYNATRHTVLEVTEPNYNACTFTSPLLNDNGVGNSNITLDKEGDTYFVCSVGTHCAVGMKFKATVLAANASASPPPPNAAPVLPSAGLGTAAAVVGLIGFLVW